MMSGMSRTDGDCLIRRQVSLPPRPGISRSSRMQSTAARRAARGLLARAGQHDVVALAAQQRRELVQVRRAVVDGEDALRARAGSPSRSRSTVAARRTAARRARMTSRSSSLRTNASAPASSARSSASAVFGPVEEHAGVPRSAASRRIRRITVAPSMPGKHAVDDTASGRLAGGHAQPLLAARRDETA